MKYRHNRKPFLNVGDKVEYLNFVPTTGKTVHWKGTIYRIHAFNCYRVIVDKEYHGTYGRVQYISGPDIDNLYKEVKANGNITGEV